MRSGGLLVGAAGLKKQDYHTPEAHRGGGSSDPLRRESVGRGAVYLSGFRIVQDAAGTRHAEYRVVLVHARYERWHRYSELKALAGLAASMPAATREAWDNVRACKAPKGRTLDPNHLSGKCLAIEKFLGSLLEALSAAQLVELLVQVHARRAAPRTNNASPVAYLAPMYAARQVNGHRRHRMPVR